MSTPSPKGLVHGYDEDREYVTSRICQVTVFLAAIWAAFILDPNQSLHRYGLRGGDPDGLIGVVTMPFLHANLEHVTSTTLTIAAMLYMASLGHLNIWRVVVILGIVTHAILWFFLPPGSMAIGAGALTFALLGFGGWNAIDCGSAFGDHTPLVITILAVMAIVFWPGGDGVEIVINAFAPGEHGTLALIVGLCVGGAAAFFRGTEI